MFIADTKVSEETQDIFADDGRPNKSLLPSRMKPKQIEQVSNALMIGLGIRQMIN